MSYPTKYLYDLAPSVDEMPGVAGEEPATNAVADTFVVRSILLSGELGALMATTNYGVALAEYNRLAAMTTVRSVELSDSVVTIAFHERRET